MGFLKSRSLISYFAELWGEYFKHILFVGERGTHNLWLNCQFWRKRNDIYYITILFAVAVLSPGAPTVFGTNLTCLATPRFARIFFQYAKRFFNLRPIQIVFTSGIGTGIFWNVLEDRTEFLTWAAWALFNFYVKQKQRFSVWTFTGNASFISFHRGIWSRYSEINKFKRNKGLSFQK